MDLNSKIRLVKELIKENPDSTVRDFCETVKEIEWVEQSGEQKDNIALLASQGLVFRSHDRMIRTPAERYQLPTTERKQRDSA